MKNKLLAVFIVVAATFIFSAGIIDAATATKTKSVKATQTKTTVKKTKLTVTQALKAAEKFVSENYMDGGAVKAKNLRYANGIYYLEITVTGQSGSVNSAISDDGKYFFVNVVDIDKANKDRAKEQATLDKAKKEAEAEKVKQEAAAIKSDKPIVELFVMSHCPYGTQIEKGIIPVIELLGNKIDFRLKFVDYAMHGEKELKEEMNQYCINKNEPAKLLPYLKCFLAAGNGEECLKTANIDNGKLVSCNKDTEDTYKILANNAAGKTPNGSYPEFPIYKLDNTRYGVQGSPTLVINGQQVDSGRDAKSLLKAICAKFNIKPAECDKELSSANPSAGFGYSETTAAQTSSCGN